MSQNVPNSNVYPADLKYLKNIYSFDNSASYANSEIISNLEQQIYQMAIDHIDYLTQNQAKTLYTKLSPAKQDFLQRALATLFIYWFKQNASFTDGSFGATQGSISVSQTVVNSQNIDPKVYELLSLTGLYNQNNSVRLSDSLPSNSMNTQYFPWSDELGISKTECYRTFLWGDHLTSSNNSLIIARSQKEGYLEYDIKISDTINLNQIAINKTDIATNKTNIATNTVNIANNTGEMNSKFTTINGRLTTNEANISSNTTKVNKNIVDILNNTNLITTKISKGSIKNGANIQVVISPLTPDNYIINFVQNISTYTINFPTVAESNKSWSITLTTEQIQELNKVAWVNAIVKIPAYGGEISFGLNILTIGWLNYVNSLKDTKNFVSHRLGTSHVQDDATNPCVLFLHWTKASDTHQLIFNSLKNFNTDAGNIEITFQTTNYVGGIYGVPSS